MKKVEQLLCMNGGDGDTSYANNSMIQREIMNRTKPMLEESAREMMIQMRNFPRCLRIADFGSSSGPNALQVISDVINTVDFTCKTIMNRKEPTFQVFLNDLPRSDFNTLFMSLHNFHEKLEREKGGDFGPCFIAGMPGNFYGRLFPDRFLHFAHSSYSLHWRSQVIEGVESESSSGEAVAINKGNIYIAKSSPRRVFEAYQEIFEKDFTSFLESRSQELVSGGHMFLTMIGSDKKACFDNIKYHKHTIFELLGITLNDMVQQGLVEEKKLDSFNIPYYSPVVEEVRDMIETQGSFCIQRLETIETDWDVQTNNNNNNNKYYSTRGKYVAMTIRTVSEPILASHFGEEIMDNLFYRFAVKLDEFLAVEKGRYTNIIVSMRKK